MGAEDVTKILQDAIKNDDFIKVAYNDFQTSKLIQDSDICNTIFHLQQSSEKLAKVFLDMFHEFMNQKSLISPKQPIITDEEFERDIKKHDAGKLLAVLHKYHDTFFEELKSKGYQFSIGSIFENAGIKKADIGSEGADNLNVVKIAGYDEETLLKLMKTAKENKENLKNIKFTEIEYEKLQSDLAKIDRNKREIIISDGNKKAKKFGMGFKEYFIIILNAFSPLIYNSVCIFTYALILYPHEQAVRYPIGNNVPLAPANYINREVGISKETVIDELISGIEDVFRDLNLESN